MTALERDPASASAAQAPGVPLLRVQHLSITHDGATAPTPSSVSFEIAQGEVVLLLGPSGSGKSTLALATNGLIPHAVPADVAGTVELGGIDSLSSSVASLSTRVAMVFQDPDAQLVTGTVLDEVAFGPENLRMPVAEVLARSESALRRVGLWERRSENPDRLSGGGRQRLAIASALAMGSPLLVLDEPTANLDPRGIEEVYQALGELVAEGDRAILLVEHNLDAAVGFVDRVVVLDQEGRLTADGTVDDVLRRRADELRAMGVWLPVSALAALRLRRAGFVLDPLPLTPSELHAALEAEERPAAVVEPAALVERTPVAEPPTGAERAALVERTPVAELPTGAEPAALVERTPVAEPPGAAVEPAALVERTPVAEPPSGAQPAAVVEPPTGAQPAAFVERTPVTEPAAVALRPGLVEPPVPVTVTPLIDVRDLTLRRGGITVLHRIDLSVGEGEFVAVVGANGAGKTTLIQAIAGVIPPPRGSVRIGDLDVARADSRTLSSRIGFVFQNPEHQFIAHTVFDEVAHGLRRQHVPDAEVRERTEALLKRFGLGDKAHSHPFLLSGGQKRRLSVGTALVTGAPVLALDEPTFGQDRARADELLGLLRELNDEGTTIIVVTHDMQLVADYAARTVVMADGRIVRVGATADVFADDELIEHAGLRPPPLRRALRELRRHPELARITRLADLPNPRPRGAA